MQVHLEQTKDVHHHGVQGHLKAGGEQVTEDDHFVGAGMSNSLTRRRSADIVRTDEAMEVWNPPIVALFPRQDRGSRIEVDNNFFIRSKVIPTLPIWF